MSVIFEWCMSASIARSAFVELWHVGRDMDGLGGAEMLAQGAGMAPSQPRSTVGKQSHAPRTHEVLRPHFFESLGCVLYL